MASTYPFTSALVTGASSGIGEAMVRLLGEAGIPQVIVADEWIGSRSSPRDTRTSRYWPQTSRLPKASNA